MNYISTCRGLPTHLCRLPAPSALPQVDPLAGSVAFSAALYGWSFTLESFALLYCEVYQIPLDPKELAKR